MKIINYIVLFFISIAVYKAQDMQFTQFNAAPLYLNPGFTGATVEHRFSTSYRNQWAAISGIYENFVFSYDYNMAELNSGIGVLFAREQAGTGSLGNTEVAFLYSYHFKIDNRIFIQPGLKFNYVSRGVDFSKLIFNDQLSSGNSTSSEDIVSHRVNYLDVSVGTIVYSKKYWGGFAFNHLNKPNQSLTGKESPLPVKFSLHGGGKFKLGNNGIKKIKVKHINLAFQYKAQNKFDQLDLGAYYTQSVLVFGIWYRGLPVIKSYRGILNNDAIAFLIGYNVEEYNLKIGYSYDATISRLATNSAGSHEISIVYETASKRKKRKRRKYFTPCAKF